MKIQANPKTNPWDLLYAGNDNVKLCVENK